MIELNLVIGAIKLILRNEGYSEEKINTAINLNYAEIKDYIDRRMNSEW